MNPPNDHAMHKPDDLQKLPPVAIIRIIDAFRGFLLRLNRKLFPGTAVLYEQFQHFWLLPSLYVAAKLNIAEMLRDQPLTAEEIAARIRAHPGNTHRLMRALAGGGVFRQMADGRFKLNPMGRALLDGRGSLRHTILHHLGPVNWNLMSNLEYAVTTGQDAFRERYGTDIYRYLEDHPEEYRIFDHSMSDLSDLGLAPLLKAYDYVHYKRIVDVGGGEGFFLANILHAAPSSRGVLLDTPGSVARAPGVFARYGVGDRIEIVPGDFFKAVPAGGDLYLLKNIIHNWDDRHCSEILRHIAGAMSPEGRVLIFEMVVPDGGAFSAAKLLDIQMMASMPGGKERTGQEYREMLEGAGLTCRRTIRTIAPVSIIEAVKKR